MRPIDLSTKPNYRCLWSNEDLAPTFEMLRNEETIPIIATGLGRSPEAVGCRAAEDHLLKARAGR